MARPLTKTYEFFQYYNIYNKIFQRSMKLKEKLIKNFSSLKKITCHAIYFIIL
jgi:hypothetical protein